MPPVESGIGVDATREQRRERAREGLRDALLQAAGKRSFAELKIEEIAAAAGLSRSAFYFYYSSKYELLRDATGRVAEELFADASTWYEGEGESVEMIRQVLAANAASWSKHADLLRMTVEAAGYDPEIEAFWRGLLTRFIDGVARRVRADQESGSTSADVDPERAAEVLVYATETYFHRRIACDGATPPLAVEAIAPVWIGALYPDA
jgi:AcrR family transcriptional regulator